MRNPGDERLRDLERRAGHGDVQARAAAIRERLRRGLVTEEQVTHAAFLGDKAAAFAVGRNVPDALVAQWPSLNAGEALWSLSPEDRSRFNADCLEHVLPIMGKRHTERRTWVESVIISLRSWASASGNTFGETVRLTGHQWDALVRNAIECIRAAQQIPHRSPRYWVLSAAGSSTGSIGFTDRGRAFTTAAWCIEARVRSVKDGTERYAARKAEQEWQRDRCVQYLLGEATSMTANPPGGDERLRDLERLRAHQERVRPRRLQAKPKRGRKRKRGR